MRVFILALLFAGLADAKVVHLVIQVSQTAQYRDQYTVDKSLPIWRFRDRVFGDYNLDKNSYAVAQDTKDGLIILDLDSPLESYGNGPDDPVLLRVVPKRNLPQEQPVEEPKPEMKEEIPMAVAMPEIKLDKPEVKADKPKEESKPDKSSMTCKKLAEGVEVCTSVEVSKPESKPEM